MIPRSDRPGLDFPLFMIDLQQRLKKMKFDAPGVEHLVDQPRGKIEGGLAHDLVMEQNADRPASAGLLNELVEQ